MSTLAIEKQMAKDIVKRLDGRIVVASISGGKDSAALSLWLTEHGIEHRRVFADTGWEHRHTYEYLRGDLVAKIGPIDEVGYPGGMEGLILKKQMFPSRVVRFCTEELKVFPLSAYVRKVQDELGEAVNAVGIRRAESKARSTMEEWEWSNTFDSEVWRPIIHWTEQDVIDIHTRHGLRPNPLYLLGAERVGCFPCIFARKQEVKLVAEIAPERIEQIRVLEAAVPPSKAKPAVKEIRDDGGRVVVPAAPALPEVPRTFFHGKLSREGKPFPIDTIVEWSKTSQGGKQYQLIEEEAPEGCVRWGLCDVAEKK